MRTISNPIVRSISKDQLSLKLKNNDPIEVINVLKPDDYHLGIIKGSKKIPLGDLEERLHEIDKNKEIITYCAGYDCSASRQAAEKLAGRGYKVRVYEGGVKEWKQANLPTE